MLVFARWLPALIWMMLIFVGSTDVLSANHTSRFIEPMLRWLFKGISQARVDDIHFFIRKTGHVCEYATLALLFCWALRPWAPAEPLPPARAASPGAPDGAESDPAGRATTDPTGPGTNAGRGRRVVVRGPGALVTALLLAAAYAAGDEFHQSFVSSRGASVHDVVIDTVGALLALSAAWAWHTFRDRRRAALPARADVAAAPAALSQNP